MVEVIDYMFFMVDVIDYMFIDVMFQYGFWLDSLLNLLHVLPESS